MSWQFPQGGIRAHESAEEALYRELLEEVGLQQQDVSILGSTRGWLRYRLPRRFIRHHSKPVCIGQKQRWFLLRMLAEDSQVQLDLHTPQEFDKWCWVPYWQPIDEIVTFKRRVYERALIELAPLLGEARPLHLLQKKTK